MAARPSLLISNCGDWKQPLDLLRNKESIKSYKLKEGKTVIALKLFTQ